MGGHPEKVLASYDGNCSACGEHYHLKQVSVYPTHCWKVLLHDPGWPQTRKKLQSVVFYTLNSNIKQHQTLKVSSLWLQLTGQLKIPRKGWGKPLPVTGHTARPNKPVISWSSLVHSSSANPYPQLLSLLPIVLSAWPPWSVWLNREWVSWSLGFWIE